MENLKILNNREIKQILDIIKRQWNADFKPVHAFLMNNKSKIFIINRDVSKIDLSKLRVNNIGMYFGEIVNDELRLSIEGSQLVGLTAKKGIIELNEKEARGYLKGEEIDKKTKEKGFLIIKHNNDFLGTGKSNGEKIFNYTPKERRITASD